MDQQVKLNYFKLPFQKNEEMGMLISILDCSGSMSSYWKYVAQYFNELKQKAYLSIAITFDTNVKVLQPNENISPYINQYGGGGTNITNAFVALNQEIMKQKITSDLTVVFVSDGEGYYDEVTIKSNIPKVENLNFICVGVGNGFPTHISMSLRSLYHTGNLQIAPVLIVDVHDQKNQNREQYLNQIFQEEFEYVGNILVPRKQCETTPVLCFPWDQEKTTKIWSGVWVASQDYEITCEGTLIQPQIPSNAMILELAAYWLQNIQLLSLKAKVKQEAQIALSELERLSNSIPKVQKQQKQKTFAQRIQGAQSENTEFSDLVAELRQFTRDFQLNQLNDKDAADRLKIGTKIGKYHHKAIKFAGLSIDEFQNAKTQFIECLKQHKFLGGDGDRSIITLQCQKEILQEEDLIQGLEDCSSQYQLVTAFPIIGYGLQVIRSNASMIDPYKIEIVSLVRIHKFLDSVSLIENQQHELRFSIGNGEEEVVNCILPLYTQKDKNLKSFFKSKLFHTIMTFIVCENADVCFEHSYAALLANTLYFLMRQPQSDWTKEMICLINQSYCLVYNDYFTKNLINNPIQTFVDFNKKQQTKCQDTILALLALSSKKNELQQQQIRDVIDRFIIETIGRNLNDMNLEDHINLFVNLDEPQILNDMSQTIINKYDNQKLKEYRHISEITTEIQSDVDTIKVEDWKMQMRFKNEEAIKLLEKTRFSYENLQCIYQYFLLEEFKQDLFIAALFHARYQKSKERANNRFIFDFDQITQVIQRIKHQFLIEKLLRKCSFEIKNHVEKMGFFNLLGQQMPGKGLVKDELLRELLFWLRIENPEF